MELARLRADGIRAPEGKECAEARSMTRPVLNFRIRRYFPCLLQKTHNYIGGRLIFFYTRKIPILTHMFQMGWNHQLDKQLRSKSSNLDQFFQISTDSVCSVDFSPRNQTWFLRFYHIVWRYSPSIRSDYTGGGGTWFFHKDGSWLDILVGWILCSQDGLDKSFLLKGDSVICLLFFEACRSTMLHNGKKTTCFIIRTYLYTKILINYQKSTVTR